MIGVLSYRVVKKDLFDKLVFEQKLSDIRTRNTQKFRGRIFQPVQTVNLRALINLIYQLSF